MKAEYIARALHARRIGSQWMALCPSHRDRKPSLALRAGTDGRVLVHCHAGCDQAKVLDAVKADRVIVATYDYTDEGGNLLYQIVRTQPKASISGGRTRG